MGRFLISESKKVLEIEESIKKTDKEIDVMVYQLYNLTSEEIEIIESSFENKKHSQMGQRVKIFLHQIK